MSKRRNWLVSLVVVALVAISGVASADDTTINSGYDEENQTLILESHSEEDDCTWELEDGERTYTIDDEGLVQVDGVTSEGDADADCEWQAIDVTGPVGQVNHGTFVSAIATLYDGANRGCVIRYFAQSDLGKDDQQINADEVEDGETTESTGGTATFESVVAECEANGNQGEEASAQGQSNRPELDLPERAGQGGSDSPAKSGSAPGRDR